MKTKKLLVLSGIFLGSFGSVFAAENCGFLGYAFDTYFILGSRSDSSVSNQDKINAFQNLINILNNKINELKTQNNVTVSNNFSGPYVFGEVSGTGAVQKIDPSSGISYTLFPSVTGKKTR